jgi:hypothetical protein
MSRKKLFIVVGVVVFLSVCVVALRSGNDTTKQTPTIQEPGTNEAWTVTITNVDQYEEITTEQSNTLSKGLYTFLKKNVPSAEIAYTGNIRENSLAKSLTPAGYPKVEFLVDIAKLERTYKVTLEGAADTEYQTVYVTCPSTAELVYKPTPCSDEQ